MFRALLKKELRQLLPLTLAGFGVAFILFVLVVILPFKESTQIGFVILAFMGLSATSVTASVVLADEHTRKTARFLAALPVSPFRIWSVKILAVVILTLGAFLITVSLALILAILKDYLVGGNLHWVSDFTAPAELMDWGVYYLSLISLGFFSSSLFKHSATAAVCGFALWFLSLILIQDYNVFGNRAFPNTYFLIYFVSVFLSMVLFVLRMKNKVLSTG